MIELITHILFNMLSLDIELKVEHQANDTLSIISYDHVLEKEYWDCNQNNDKLDSMILSVCAVVWLNIILNEFIYWISDLNTSSLIRKQNLLLRHA